MSEAPATPNLQQDTREPPLVANRAGAYVGPVNSENSTVPPPRERMFNVPGAVLALAALLAAIHALLAFVLTNDQANDLLALFAFSPLRYADTVPSGLPAWWGPQLWSFVTYAFFHADINHLAINLVWLMAFGPPIARRFGPSRFLIFCAATAAAGAAAHLATHLGQFAPMIGASAAISGTMAAAMRFVFQRGGPLGLLGRGEEESYHVPRRRCPRCCGIRASWRSSPCGSASTSCSGWARWRCPAAKAPSPGKRISEAFSPDCWLLVV